MPRKTQRQIWPHGILNAAKSGRPSLAICGWSCMLQDDAHSAGWSETSAKNLPKPPRITVSSFSEYANPGRGCHRFF